MQASRARPLAGLVAIGIAVAIVAVALHESGSGGRDATVDRVARDKRSRPDELPTVSRADAESDARVVARAAEDGVLDSGTDVVGTVGSVLADVQRLTEAACFGGISVDQVAMTTERLLSLIDPEAEPILEHGGDVAVFPIVDDPDRGAVSLRIELSPDHSGQDFVLSTKLPSNPGYYTGFAGDGAEWTRCDITYEVDESGHLEFSNTLVEPRVHRTSALAESLHGQPPLTIGGAFTVRDGSADWRPLTLSVVREALVPDTGEKVTGWMTQLGVPVQMPGSADQPRMIGVVEKLVARRSTVQQGP